MITCGTLAPTLDAFAVNSYQQNATLRRASKARLKEMNQRHANLAQRDRFYSHAVKVSNAALTTQITPRSTSPAHADSSVQVPQPLHRYSEGTAALSPLASPMHAPRRT